jgi:hypothetical protein
MSITSLGCCGAYCGTCPAFKENMCRGCKLGYDDGKRDLSKARCKMKVCCMNKGFNSCADCDLYDSCEIIQGLYSKNGYKYQKYREATLFIRVNGYEKFLKIADQWKLQYGKYK